MSEFLSYNIGLILEAKEGLAWFVLRRDWQSIQGGSQDIGIDSSPSTTLRWTSSLENEWMDLFPTVMFKQLYTFKSKVSKMGVSQWWQTNHFGFPKNISVNSSY